MIVEIEETAEFKKWVESLKNPQDEKKIYRRLEKIHQTGFLGEYKRLDHSIVELHITGHTRYRVYSIFHEGKLIIFNGGTRSTKGRDIPYAEAAAQAWRAEHKLASKAN